MVKKTTTQKLVVRSGSGGRLRKETSSKGAMVKKIKKKRSKGLK